MPAQNIQIQTRKIVLLPIGSCEQHGPHLPFDTDLRIAQLIAQELNKKIENSFLLPAIPFSCSWEHKGPNTIAVNVSTLAAYVRDVATSLKTWDTPIFLVLVNWHGGNDLLGALATEISATIGIPTAAIPSISQVGKSWDESNITTAKDVHAGAIETSVILAYWLVLIKGAITSQDHCEPEIKPAKAQAILQSVGIRAVTDAGVWGAPEKADKRKGKLLIQNLVNNLYEQILKVSEIIESHQKEK